MKVFFCKGVGDVSQCEPRRKGNLQVAAAAWWREGQGGREAYTNYLSVILPTHIMDQSSWKRNAARFGNMIERRLDCMNLDLMDTPFLSHSLLSCSTSPLDIW